MKKIYLVLSLVAVFGLITGFLISNGSVDITGKSTLDDSVDITLNPEKITVLFFWGEGCPYCEHQKLFLKEMETKYGEYIEVVDYETWRNRDNVPILMSVAESYGVRVTGVPVTFICDKHWIGYSDRIGGEMERFIINSIESGCVSPLI